MKPIFKKTMSMMLMMGLITSQVACGRKPIKQNISSPIDQVKFEKDYKYAVKLKTGEKTEFVTGDQIQAKHNELILKSPTQSKSLMSQDIERVNGVGTKRVGSYAGEGFAIGAATGIVATVTTVLIASSGCSDSNNNDDVWFTCDEGRTLALVFLTPAGMLAGGALGAISGAFISKHDKVQITPVVSPTAQGGVDAGVNVGVRF